MSTRMTRLVRGSLAATAATFVALFSHVLGGGSLPSAAALSLSLAFAVLVCMLFSGRTASLWRSAVSIGLSQFVFHAFFGSMGAPGSATAAVDPMVGMHPASQHSDLLAIATGDGATVHSSPSMWLAHAIAALITVIAFSWGERAWAGLVVTARGILTRLLPVPRVATLAHSAASQRAPLDLDVVAHTARVFLSPMRHRGPPALASV